VSPRRSFGHERSLAPSKIYNISDAFEYLHQHGAPLKSPKALYMLTHRRALGHFHMGRVLYMLTHRRALGHFHMGRELRFRQSDLDAYLLSIRGPEIPPRKGG
jgi:hypothetical protein